MFTKIKSVFYTARSYVKEAMFVALASAMLALTLSNPVLFLVSICCPAVPALLIAVPFCEAGKIAEERREKRGYNFAMA